MFRAASGPGDDVSLLAAEAIEVRDLLHTDASALAKRRLLDEGRVAQLRSGTGYKNIAFDVLGLVALLREHWTRIERKTAIEAAELDDAERLSDRLITALGLREQGPAALTQAMATRQRAFVLFCAPTTKPGALFSSCAGIRETATRSLRPCSRGAPAVVAPSPARTCRPSRHRRSQVHPRRAAQCRRRVWAPPRVWACRARTRSALSDADRLQLEPE